MKTKYLSILFSRTKWLTLLLCLCTLTAKAQQYMVYSAIGEVSEVKGGKKVPLTPRKQLTAGTKVVIDKESSLVLLDEKNSRMYCFTATGTFTVSQLLMQKNSSKKELSKQYMNYMVKKLFASGSQKMAHPDTYMQATATAYRSPSTDSLLLGKLMAMIHGQTADGQQAQTPTPLSAEQALTQSSTLIDSDLDVGFELISCETGMPLTRGVKPNTSCYVRAHNRTNEVLYMNVLDIDSEGHKYLVLPVDEASTCAHLLVPPMSTVSFKSEPLIFGEEPSKESFILVATEEPIDFSILMNPIQYSGKEQMKAGLHRNFYEVSIQ